MRQLLIFIFLFITCSISAQQNYYGIQGSPRKGMLSALMNPADLNNLSKTVETHFLSTQVSFSNNTLRIRDFFNSEDAFFLEAFRDSEQAFNGRTVASMVGPSVGINLGRFAFGLTTEFKGSAHFINVDPTLGQYLTDGSFEPSISSINLNTQNNQRANQNNWMEIGLMGAFTVFESKNQKLSLGANLKFIRPGTYTNIAVDQFVGNIVVEGSEILLTGASSEIELSYNENLESADIFSPNIFEDLFGNPTSIGFDLGISHQLKNRQQQTLLNTGLTVRNLGNISYSKDQITRSYGMNIPENTSFNLRELTSDLQQVEALFLQSALFTNTSESTVNTLSLPTVLALNTDLVLTDFLQFSFYGQKAFGDSENNSQIPVQEFYSFIPRLTLGKFEVYSPWTFFDFSGFNGGLGLRFGGLFLGSYSALTGLTLDSKQADIHLGFSWGFGSGLL
ncbi:hypothetical protein [Arthrospiribacter ruber]|uniref:DUF5723 domain-containing protein n=1 Tax=Arthrospiribacter ruber TaxID=2487934 RepID=A0A951MFE8_9BACT|nr:hypothetical protein [Arthrospiribacter ruber]MBW3468501.1 hypothetical protein [Arthrospiribacter ruber]